MPVTKELDERIDKCRKILDVDPNSQIFAALAEAHRRKGELDKAFRVCQNGLKIHPSYGSSHVVMSKINLDRGLYDWAAAEVRKAIELDGNSRASELLLAEISLYQGDSNTAVRLLKQLHDNDPYNKQIKKLLDIAQKVPEYEPVMAGGIEIVSAYGAVASAAPVAEAVEVAKPFSYADIIALAGNIEGVTGAMIIGHDGVPLESHWTSTLDRESCAAGWTQVNELLDKELVRASYGAIDSMLIESDNTTFYSLAVPVGTLLFLGDQNLNLGTLRMRVSGMLAKCEAEAAE